MKLLTVIFCLVVSVGALGQSRDASAKAKPLNPVTKKDTLIVINGEPTKNKLNNIDPRNILTVTILKNDGKDLSMNSSNKVVVVIVTKQAAIKAYQKKLSAFSKGYADYLLANKNDDEGLWYIIKGSSTKHDESQISKLYALKKEKIKSVDFEKHYADDAGFTGRVIITTKK